MTNQFYKKKNGIKLNDILLELGKNKQKFNPVIKDIKELETATKFDITFFNSINYLNILKVSKTQTIITNKKFLHLIPKKIKVIEVSNVLLSVYKITSLFYPDSLKENYDTEVSIIENKKYKKLKVGKNVLVGKNVNIGKNCTIGHNTIIESNVEIGENCNIGCNVILKNTIVGNNTNILDGSVVGKKGFGFFPSKKGNIRYPHIGSVIIGNNVEIGCNNTIDRGSLSNTIIGDGTFLDNQVHIAHNVKIGKNCIITGQVGFAGSSSIGNNVLIGGQAGISGHLKVGDNVQIGGGSGVIKNIPSNTKVMGYPAKNIRKFLRESR